MKNLQPWEHSAFYDAYNDGNLIEDSFGLLRMADIVSEPSVSSIIVAHAQGTVHDTYFHKQIGSLKAAVDEIY